MKFIFVITIVIFSSNIVLAQDFSSKEVRKDFYKKLATIGYNHGLYSESSNACEEAAAKAKKAILQDGLGWNDSDTLMEIPYQACIIGQKDRKNGENSLPMLYRLCDIAVDYASH
jgi:hypothetical protein